MTNTMRRIRGYQRATVRRPKLVKFQANSIKHLVSGPRRARNRKQGTK